MFLSNWIEAKYPQKDEKFTINIKIPNNSVQKRDFLDVADSTAKLIASTFNNLAVVITGGLDSEFIATTLIRNKIPFQPVIFITPYDPYEYRYALNFCSKNNLKPIVLDYSDEEKFNTVIVPIITKFMYTIKRGKWLGSLPYVVSTLVPGDYIIGSMDPLIHTDHSFYTKADPNLILYDYDFFTINQMDNVCSFLGCTEDMFFNFVANLDFSLSAQEAKRRLYGDLMWRPKIEVMAPQDSYVIKACVKIKQVFSDSINFDDSNYSFGHKDAFIARYMK
jgi:hypothetical protein